jgi:hypothetical protein
MDEAQYPDFSSDRPEWNPDQKPLWIRLLDQIATDCRTEGWDDNHAVPVTAEAITAARLLCGSMVVVPLLRDGGIHVSFLGESISMDIDGHGTVTGVYLDTTDANTSLDAMVAGYPDPSAESTPCASGPLIGL